MAIRPEFRWWILTLGVVAVLLAISALALDRPDVVWEEGVCLCPHCRTPVNRYSRRCPACREEFDWVAAPEDRSPLSHWSLSALEADLLHQRKNALGREVASERVAAALGISREAATLYLDRVGRGRCGWCGGTGIDLSEGPRTERPCPVCLGRRLCVGSGGDRHVRVGDEAAHVALLAYRAGIADIRGDVPIEVQREEVRHLAERFLRRHAGTEEAASILHWEGWHPSPEAPPPVRTVVEAARGRLDAVLTALAGD